MKPEMNESEEMNNENIELSRYLLDEMTAEEKEAFEKELASREDWQAELSWLQDTVSLVKKHDVGDEVLSDESKARILAAASFLPKTEFITTASL